MMQWYVKNYLDKMITFVKTALLLYSRNQREKISKNFNPLLCSDNVDPGIVTETQTKKKIVKKIIKEIKNKK